MDYLIYWQNLLITSISATALLLLKLIPQIVGIILILSIGFSLAYWIGKGVIYLTKIIGIDKLENNYYYRKVVRRSRIIFKPSNAIGVLVQLIVAVPFFLAVFSLLGLEQIGEGIVMFVGSLPVILNVFVISISGYLLASLIQFMLRLVTNERSKTVELLVKLFVGIFTLIVIYNVLPIPEIVTDNLLYALPYALLLTLSIAVGLGMKDLISEVVRDIYRKRL